MKTQNLIKQLLSRPDSVVVVQQILEDNGEASRTAIVERACEQFGCFDALGKAQKIGCLKALRELQQAGRSSPHYRRTYPEAFVGTVHGPVYSGWNRPELQRIGAL